MENKQEEEANTFAVELLMPEFMIRTSCAGKESFDQKAIKDLANEYQVTEQLMTIRLAKLGYLIVV